MLPLQNAALDRAADQWLAREDAIPGLPLAERAAADTILSPVEKSVVQLKIQARETVAASARAARVKGLDDRLGIAARDFATAPAAYRVGSLAAIADAYAAAGAPEQAAVLRRVVAQEPLLRQLVQIAEPRQRMALDALPPEARPAAEAILRQQADAFARDAFTAGTALYADVGKPAPIDDAESRIVQARTIADRRGIPVAPFSGAEIARQRDAVLARYEALPDDMQRALAPLLWPQPTLSVRETASDIADDDPALHADGVEIAQAPPEDAPPAADTQPPLREYRLFAPLPGEEDRPVEAPTEATGTRGSAPATEPDPGSPEYLAADAEARRIVAAQAKEQPTQAKSAGSAFMAPPPVTAPRTAVAAAKAAGGRAVDVARAPARGWRPLQASPPAWSSDRSQAPSR